LISPAPQSYGFPAIPGVKYPGLVNELNEMAYSVQPPKSIPGHNYLILVPKIDENGNEVPGIRIPAIGVPRGTHTGWNLRRRGFAEGELVLLGSYFPFAATKEERLASGDLRPSLEERYPTEDDYVTQIARAAEELCNMRLLLSEDVERIVNAAAALIKGR